MIFLLESMFPMIRYRLNKILLGQSLIVSRTFHGTAVVAVPNPYKAIDWRKHNDRHFVVVDPMSAKGGRLVLLYLTEPAYERLVRIALSNAVELEVIATPTDRAETVEELSSQWDTDHGVSSGPVDSSSRSDSSNNTPPERGGHQCDVRNPVLPYGRQDVVDAWQALSRWINPLLKPRAPGDARIKVIDNLVEPTSRNVRRLITVHGSRLAWWLGISFKDSLLVKESWAMSKHLSHLLEKNGLQFVILYLKASVVVTFSFLGKIPLTDTTGLKVKVGLSHGLPSFLPRRWRAMIRSGNIPFIRWIVSMLSLYRSMRGPYGDPNLETIRSTPYTKGYPEGFEDFCNALFRRFKNYFTPQKMQPDWAESSATWSTSSGPNVRPAHEGWHEDFSVLKILGLIPLVQRWLTLVSGGEYPGKGPPEPIRFSRAEALLRPVSEVPEKVTLPEQEEAFKEMTDKGWLFGKLSLKEEPAGKLRVFAIGNWVLQVLFEPLHKGMEKVLKSFPQDASFDQDGKTEEFAKRQYERYWSFDLTAATDLIPRLVYRPILTCLLGEEAGRVWEELLTRYPYTLIASAKSGKGRAKSDRSTGNACPGTDTHVRYGRGQPMGLRSSWPSLALAHHLIVQYSAYKVGFAPLTFTAYLVLGDDVVIADEAVAGEYLKVTSHFEIPVGLAKSFAGAKGFFQFANQDWFNGTNVSPTSLKADLASRSLPEAIEFVRSVIARWPDTSGWNVVRALRLLTDPFQWVVSTIALTKWRFGATSGTLLRTLLVPGSAFGRLLESNTGSSVILWLVSVTREVSTSEVKEVMSGDGKRFTEWTKLPVPAIIAEIALAYIRGLVNDALSAIVKTREAVKRRPPMFSFGVREDFWTARPQVADRGAREVADEFWSTWLPYMQEIRTSPTLGHLWLSMMLLKDLIESLPRPMDLEARKGPTPNPLLEKRLPRLYTSEILTTLKQHGHKVRRVALARRSADRSKRPRTTARTGGRGLSPSTKKSA